MFKWGGNVIKVVISFDDGRKDNYRIAEKILKPLQIPATFNITTSYIMDEDVIKPCRNKPLSKAEVVELSKCPLFEIAGHGHEHQNNIDNLILGINDLKEWCQSDEIMGLASPNSQICEMCIKADRHIYEENQIRYIRIGDRIKTYTFIKKWIRRLNRILKDPRIFYWVYKETLLDKEDGYILYSIPVLQDVNSLEILYIINKAIYHKKSVILMFHSVVKEGEAYYRDRWSWDYDEFLKLCKTLKNYERQGKLKLSKTIEMARVMKKC